MSSLSSSSSGSTASFVINALTNATRNLSAICGQTTINGELLVTGTLVATGGVVADTIAGTIITPVQPDILSLGTLTGLALSGNLTSTADISCQNFNASGTVTMDTSNPTNLVVSNKTTLGKLVNPVHLGSTINYLDETANSGTTSATYYYRGSAATNGGGLKISSYFSGGTETNGVNYEGVKYGTGLFPTMNFMNGGNVGFYLDETAQMFISQPLKTTSTVNFNNSGAWKPTSTYPALTTGPSVNNTYCSSYSNNINLGSVDSSVYFQMRYTFPGGLTIVCGGHSGMAPTIYFTTTGYSLTTVASVGSGVANRFTFDDVYFCCGQRTLRSDGSAVNTTTGGIRTIQLNKTSVTFDSGTYDPTKDPFYYLVIGRYMAGQSI